MIFSLTDDERRDLIAALEAAIDAGPDVPKRLFDGWARRADRWRDLRSRLAAMAQPEPPEPDPEIEEGRWAPSMGRR